MKYFSTPLITIVHMVLLMSISCSSETRSSDQVTWSEQAHSISYQDRHRLIRVCSPDSSKIVIIDDMNLAVTVQGDTVPGTDDIGVSTLAELSWAENSKGFFITESLGGATGEWRVTAFLIRNGEVHRMDIAENAINEFKKTYECKKAEEPNIFGITWMNGTERILLVAQVPPHSSCPEMGNLMGYIVSVTSGDIIEEIDQKELLSEWKGHLGERFDYISK